TMMGASTTSHALLEKNELQGGAGAVGEGEGMNLLESLAVALSAFYRVQPIVLVVAAIAFAGGGTALVVGAIQHWPVKDDKNEVSRTQPTGGQGQTVQGSPGSTNLQAAHDIVINNTPTASPGTTPLTSLSDAQRYALRSRLQAHSGNAVRLVLVG